MKMIFPRCYGNGNRQRLVDRRFLFVQHRRKKITFITMRDKFKLMRIMQVFRIAFGILVKDTFFSDFAYSSLIIHYKLQKHSVQNDTAEQRFAYFNDKLKNLSFLDKETYLPYISERPHFTNTMQHTIGWDVLPQEYILQICIFYNIIYFLLCNISFQHFLQIYSLSTGPASHSG